MKVFIRRTELKQRQNKEGWECKSGNLVTTSLVSKESCLKSHKKRLRKEFCGNDKNFLKTIEIIEMI